MPGKADWHTRFFRDPGGDWGHVIAYKMGVKAWHTNFLWPLSSLHGQSPLDSGAPPTLISHPLLLLRQLFRPYTTAEEAGIQSGKKGETISRNNQHNPRHSDVH
ncbi:hypothetical protein K435DRAFT_862776 [Dendrothele bispora CBS 962.96]|uniref:Uncharacterized protein n=1 Tax=Dendrothele bispora (strain CBS 962.96) TaxID=1314807 RepID=A0A4S8LRL0_DENBC|nr:hypothetical protein K435DRAFT_862776 [Dendrothele bispora CBS 962.96]